jgi:hypothetical protein
VRIWYKIFGNVYHNLLEDIMKQDELKALLMKWYKEFIRSPTEPMDQETTLLFLDVLSCELRKDPLPEEIREAPSFRLMENRATSLDLKISVWVIVFLTDLGKGIPSNMVMYISMLKYYTWKSDSPQKVIIMEDLFKLFPMGFPTKDAINKLWDLQKYEEENLLDITL